jgi:RND family efflux transporter MFP subunit
MKRIAILAILALPILFFSCKKEEKEPQTPEEKKAYLTKLKTDLSEIQAKINALEGELKDKDAENALKPVTAEAFPVKTFEHFIEVQGNVKTDRNVLVNPEINGIILNINVKKGDQVSQGQVIASVDNSQFQKTIEELNTRLDLAKDVFRRQENLWNQKIGSELQFIQSKNAVESLEKSIETVKNQMSKTVVKAPISGMVDELFANKGEMATPAMPIARVIDISTVQVEADVSETYLGKLKKGDKVNLSIPVLNRELEEQIEFISQFIDPANRTFKVMLEVPNADRTLMPNLVTVLKIKDFTKENAVSVPTNIIQQASDGSKFVYTVSSSEGKGVVKKVAIKIGTSYNGYTLIEEGLTGGENLVMKGYSEVVDGEEVQLVKE